MSEANHINLCPVKLSTAGDRIICSISVRSCDRWKKFSIACDTPKELWDTVAAINAKGAQALADATLTGNAGTDHVAVEYDYIAEKVREFIGKGGKIKRIPSGESSFLSSKIDINSLVDELDKIPDLVAEELAATNDADVEHTLEEDEVTPITKVA